MADHMRLRAPQDHGQTLQIPSLGESGNLVAANRNLLSNYPQELQSIRSIARNELAAMALRYSRQYCDADVELHDQVVMSGHQPTLFHPGVWFKNFALDAAAKSASATAINLVVDNDLCADVNVACPQKIANGAKLNRVAYDGVEIVLPFEMRKVKDREVFDSFETRLAASVAETVASPLIRMLWPEVQAVGDLALPASIAAGRHRLEQTFGLGTLELPVSRMSTSESFARFVQRLASEASRFIEIHNQALAEYRKANRVRSRSHPVPELDSDGSFNEIPFWVWTTEDPNRRRLFVRDFDGGMELTDRGDWSVTFGCSEFTASFQELNQVDSNVFIRPRALATTMFSRLFASDLFLHGIGGAKYDQLNDVIISRFFEIVPPQFMTMTATMKLPFEYQSVTKQNVSALEDQLRRMRFHPEFRLTGDEDAIRKGWLIENEPSGSRKQWRDEIAAINERLFERIEGKAELEGEIALVKNALPTSKILGSREYSFALFPEKLVEELRVLSTEY